MKKQADVQQLAFSDEIQRQIASLTEAIEVANDPHRDDSINLDTINQVTEEEIKRKSLGNMNSIIPKNGSAISQGDPSYEVPNSSSTNIDKRVVLGNGEGRWGRRVICNQDFRDYFNYKLESPVNVQIIEFETSHRKFSDYTEEDVVGSGDDGDKRESQPLLKSGQIAIIHFNSEPPEHSSIKEGNMSSIQRISSCATQVEDFTLRATQALKLGSAKWQTWNHPNTAADRQARFQIISPIQQLQEQQLIIHEEEEEETMPDLSGNFSSGSVVFYQDFDFKQLQEHKAHQKDGCKIRFEMNDDKVRLRLFTASKNVSDEHAHEIEGQDLPEFSSLTANAYLTNGTMPVVTEGTLEDEADSFIELADVQTSEMCSSNIKPQLEQLKDESCEINQIKTSEFLIESRSLKDFNTGLNTFQPALSHKASYMQKLKLTSVYGVKKERFKSQSLLTLPPTSPDDFVPQLGTAGTLEPQDTMTSINSSDLHNFFRECPLDKSCNCHQRKQHIIPMKPMQKSKSQALLSNTSERCRCQHKIPGKDVLRSQRNTNRIDLFAGSNADVLCSVPNLQSLDDGDLNRRLDGGHRKTKNRILKRSLGGELNNRIQQLYEDYKLKNQEKEQNKEDGGAENWIPLEMATTSKQQKFFKLSKVQSKSTLLTSLGEINIGQDSNSVGKQISSSSLQKRANDVGISIDKRKQPKIFNEYKDFQSKQSKRSSSSKEYLTRVGNQSNNLLLRSGRGVKRQDSQARRAHNTIIGHKMDSLVDNRMMLRKAGSQVLSLPTLAASKSRVNEDSQTTSAQRIYIKSSNKLKRQQVETAPYLQKIHVNHIKASQHNTSSRRKLPKVQTNMAQHVDVSVNDIGAEIVPISVTVQPSSSQRALRVIPESIETSKAPTLGVSLDRGHNQSFVPHQDAREQSNETISPSGLNRVKQASSNIKARLQKQITRQRIVSGSQQNLQMMNLMGVQSNATGTAPASSTFLSKQQKSQQNIVSRASTMLAPLKLNKDALVSIHSSSTTINRSKPAAFGAAAIPNKQSTSKTPSNRSTLLLHPIKKSKQTIALSASQRLASVTKQLFSQTKAAAPTSPSAAYQSLPHLNSNKSEVGQNNGTGSRNIKDFDASFGKGPLLSTNRLHSLPALPVLFSRNLPLDKLSAEDSSDLGADMEYMKPDETLQPKLSFEYHTNVAQSTKRDQKKKKEIMMLFGGTGGQAQGVSPRQRQIRSLNGRRACPLTEEHLAQKPIAKLTSQDDKESVLVILSPRSCLEDVQLQSPTIDILDNQEAEKQPKSCFSKRNSNTDKKSEPILSLDGPTQHIKEVASMIVQQVSKIGEDWQVNSPIPYVSSINLKIVPEQQRASQKDLRLPQLNTSLSQRQIIPVTQRHTISDDLSTQGHVKQQFYTERRQQEEHTNESQVAEIRQILRACADDNIVQDGIYDVDDESVESMAAKNDQILSTLSHMIETFEEQLQDLGHDDFSSFFQHLQFNQLNMPLLKTPQLSSLGGGKPAMSSCSDSSPSNGYRRFMQQDRLQNKVDALRRRIAKQPSLLKVQMIENQLITAQRQSSLLQMQRSDQRIFFKNRFKSLKKVRTIAKKQTKRDKQDKLDFKLIKDEVQAQNAQLNLKRKDISRLDHQVAMISDQNVRVTAIVEKYFGQAQIDQVPLAEIMTLVNEVSALESQYKKVCTKEGTMRKQALNEVSYSSTELTYCDKAQLKKMQHQNSAWLFQERVLATLSQKQSAKPFANLRISDSNQSWMKSLILLLDATTIDEHLWSLQSNMLPEVTDEFSSDAKIASESPAIKDQKLLYQGVLMKDHRDQHTDNIMIVGQKLNGWVSLPEGAAKDITAKLHSNTTKLNDLEVFQLAMMQKYGSLVTSGIEDSADDHHRLSEKTNLELMQSIADSEQHIHLQDGSLLLREEETGSQSQFNIGTSFETLRMQTTQSFKAIVTTNSEEHLN